MGRMVTVMAVLIVLARMVTRTVMIVLVTVMADKTEDRKREWTTRRMADKTDSDERVGMLVMARIVAGR